MAELMNSAWSEQKSFEVREASDVAEARRVATRLVSKVNFSDLETANVALVATELATNLIKHAQRGRMIMRLLERGKDPGVESLIKVCDYLGITLSWLLYGYEIDPTSENLLLEIQRADQETRDALLTLLRSKANQNQPPA